MKIPKRVQSQRQMKKKMATIASTFLACVIGVGIGACNGQSASSNHSTEQSVVDSIRIDSILESGDTFALDEQTEYEPLPIVKNELFDDFVFNFDQSARLQRSRVVFPLPVEEADGETHSIERNDWRHHALFFGLDFCTVLWNTRSQMELALDSNVCEASIEHIYLHSRTIDKYNFERDSTDGLWMLTSIADTPFEHYELQGFLDFYRQFATDSVFQRQHIRDPLNFTTIDEDSEYERIEGTIDADQWFEFAPEIPQDVITNINYGQSFPNPNRMVVQMRGLRNGLQNLLIFHRNISGQWQLTDYEN